MNEKEFLQKIKEIKVIVPDEQFFLEYNSVVYSILKENQQLKEQLETSEKARIDAIELINKVINMRKNGYSYEQYKKYLYETLDILDIDKGEMKDE